MAISDTNTDIDLSPARGAGKGQQTHRFFGEVVLDGTAEAAANHLGPHVSQGMGEVMPGVLPVPRLLVLCPLKLPLVLLVHCIQPVPSWH